MNKLLNFSANLLLGLGILDLFRGFMHTFNIMWASQNVAKIEPLPDSLVLMGAFGISNYLTGAIYILVWKKAKFLAPYILGLIPMTYLLGAIGLQFAGVEAQAEFKGKYMMLVYNGLCMITAVTYFFFNRGNKESVVSHNRQALKEEY
ncbi:MAG: hypothetical protein AAF518_14060 [Spirochaetota bacterium]